MARQHGTHTCYVWGPEPGQEQGCRCEPCKQANRDYERERKTRTVPPYVGADRARQHLRFLAEQGVGLKTVAQVSGISHGSLSKIVHGDRHRAMGPSKRIRRETEERILAVTPRDGAGGSRVPAGPTWKIVDRLLDRGWSKAGINRAIGNTGGGLQISRQLVTRANARAVEALLEQPVPPKVTRWGTAPSDFDLEAERREEQRRRAEADRRRHYRVIERQADEQPDPWALTGVPMLPGDTDDSWKQRAVCRRPNVPTTASRVVTYGHVLPRLRASSMNPRASRSERHVGCRASSGSATRRHCAHLSSPIGCSTRNQPCSRAHRSSSSTRGA